MTDNHQLLYRLAELMLQYEQHVLPVDLLFEDEQIGDFVKSIQIDSPYQQLLLEGVLTESVRDEKLYVSFTVEGYFHYVLGEVIYNHTEGKDAIELKKIVEENQLKGAKEGVEQCLIRDVQKDVLTRLMWLIDEGGILLDICFLPLASAFCNVYLFNKDEIEIAEVLNRRVSYIFSILFVNSTDNDILVLEKTINYLKSTQHHKLVSIIYLKINGSVIPNSVNKVKAFVDSIEFIPGNEKKEKLSQIEFFLNQNKEKEVYPILIGIADQLKNISEYEKANEFYNKGLKVGLIAFSENSIEISRLYNDFGNLLREKGDYEKALILIEKSILIDNKLYGENHPLLWASYGNLAAIFYLKGEYDSAKIKYEIALEFAKSQFGKIHPNVANLYNNFGCVFQDIGEYDEAISYFESALSVALKVYYENHDLVSSLYNNLGLVSRDKEDYEKAIYFLEKALKISLNINGDFHDTSALILANLGYIYLIKDDLDKALQLCEQSYHICQKIHGLFHTTTGNVLNTLGLIWKEKGDKEKAIGYLLESQNNDILLYGDNTHFNVGISYFNIANINIHFHMLDDALNNYTKALNIFQVSLGSNHYYTELTHKKISEINDI